MSSEMPNTPPGAPGEAGRVTAELLRSISDAARLSRDAGEAFCKGHEVGRGPLFQEMQRTKREYLYLLHQLNDSLIYGEVELWFADVLPSLLAALDAAEAGRFVDGLGVITFDGIVEQVRRYHCANDELTQAAIGAEDRERRTTAERDTARAALAGMQAERDGLAGEVARLTDDAARWRTIARHLTAHRGLGLTTHVEAWLHAPFCDTATEAVDKLIAIDTTRPSASGGA